MSDKIEKKLVLKLKKQTISIKKGNNTAYKSYHFFKYCSQTVAANISKNAHQNFHPANNKIILQSVASSGSYNIYLSESGFKQLCTQHTAYNNYVMKTTITVNGTVQ